MLQACLLPDLRQAMTSLSTPRNTTRMNLTGLLSNVMEW